MKLNGSDFIPIFMMGFLTCSIVVRLDGKVPMDSIQYPIIILACVVSAFVTMQIYRNRKDDNNDDN